MKYVSTRGGGGEVDLETTLLSGYAPDGGLYLPSTLPTHLPWKQWKGKGFKEILRELMPYFGASEMLDDETVEAAYAPFEEENVVGIAELEKDLFVLELFHGPTMSFKDYSLMLLGSLIQNVLAKSNKHRILAIATSGDTGSSAMEAVRGKGNVDLVVLLPHGRVTEIQRRQMSTVTSTNTHLFTVEGNSDECDDVLRPLFSDKDFVDKYGVGSINSINWGRILVQMTHWFYAYLTLQTDLTETLHVAVPCGACGNITAGLLAKMMGLPVELIACTGANDGVAQLIQTGTMSKDDVKKTFASAIDIQVPYNMERILYLLSEGDSQLMKQLMEDYASKGTFSLPLLLASKLKDTFSSQVSSDEVILKTVEKCHKSYGYYSCPHTSTALNYAFANQQLRPMVCISTASPDKFPEVFFTTGIGLKTKEKIKKLMEKPEVAHPFLGKCNQDGWTDAIRQKIISLAPTT